MNWKFGSATAEHIRALLKGDNTAFHNRTVVQGIEYTQWENNRTKSFQGIDCSITKNALRESIVPKDSLQHPYKHT